MTLLRGETLLENGKLHKQPGFGEYLPRGPPGAPLRRRLRRPPVASGGGGQVRYSTR